jgi:hypothetical protein
MTNTLTPAPKPPTWWERTVKFFKDSEVIFFARLQMVIAAVIVVATTMDWSPLVFSNNKKQVTIFAVMFAQGFLTEYLRRRRATDL